MIPESILKSIPKTILEFSRLYFDSAKDIAKILDGGNLSSPQGNKQIWEAMSFLYAYTYFYDRITSEQAPLYLTLSVNLNFDQPAEVMHWCENSIPQYQDIFCQIEFNGGSGRTIFAYNLLDPQLGKKKEFTDSDMLDMDMMLKATGVWSDIKQYLAKTFIPKFNEIYKKENSRESSWNPDEDPLCSIYIP